MLEKVLVDHPSKWTAPARASTPQGVSTAHAPDQPPHVR
jgi:hypothetical protein